MRLIRGSGSSGTWMHRKCRGSTFTCLFCLCLLVCLQSPRRDAHHVADQLISYHFPEALRTNRAWRSVRDDPHGITRRSGLLIREWGLDLRHSGAGAAMCRILVDHGVGALTSSRSCILPLKLRTMVSPPKKDRYKLWHSAITYLACHVRIYLSLAGISTMMLLHEPSGTPGPNLAAAPLKEGCNVNV